VTTGVLVLAVGGLLAASVAASLVAARLRLPALLLFLALGMVAGSDGAGWIHFQDHDVARELGLAALAVILFDGGQRSGFAQIRQVLVPALALATVGTVVVAVVTAMAAVALFHLSPVYGLLLGAILASTDSAAVFGLLRGSTLQRRLAQTLEGEAGFNDPVALVLVLGLLEWHQHPAYGPADLAFTAVREFALGAACGGVVAIAAAAALRRVRLPLSGLYPVASVAVLALGYGGATTLHGSGLLAAYVAGLVLGDGVVPGRQAITVFHDGAAWVAQVGLFVMLGLFSSPDRLGAVAPVGIGLALVVVLLARPLAVLVATAGQHFTLPERAAISWAGLRGAAPLVFATLPMAAGFAGSTFLFDVVLVTVVLSALVQGLTFEPLARRWGVTAPPETALALLDADGMWSLRAVPVEHRVTPVDGVVGRRVRDLGLPPGVALVVLVREGAVVAPGDMTRLRAGDQLQLVVSAAAVRRIPELRHRLEQAGFGVGRP
jgi:cell volume regulation protein A